MTEGPHIGGGDPQPRRSPPTEAEVKRLRAALAERGDAIRTRTSIELTFVDTLLRMGAAEGAGDVLDEYRSVLRAYTSDVEQLLAEQPSAGADEQPSAGADEAEPASPSDTVCAPGADDGPRARPLRRALVGALLSAVIAAAVLAPAWQGSDVGETRLAAAELAAREELAIARQRLAALQQAPAPERSVTAEARALHDQILALPGEALGREVVREQIRELLDLEHRALEDVAPHNPEALDLIDEIRAIRASLELDQPTDLPLQTELPTAPPVDPDAPPLPPTDAAQELELIPEADGVDRVRRDGAPPQGDRTDP
jgi:hypothetical protein